MASAGIRSFSDQTNRQTKKKKDKKNAFDDDNDDINGVSGWGRLSW